MINTLLHLDPISWNLSFLKTVRFSSALNDFEAKAFNAAANLVVVLPSSKPSTSNMPPRADTEARIQALKKKARELKEIQLRQDKDLEKLGIAAGSARVDRAEIERKIDSLQQQSEVIGQKLNRINHEMEEIPVTKPNRLIPDTKIESKEKIESQSSPPEDEVSTSSKTDEVDPRSTV